MIGVTVLYSQLGLISAFVLVVLTLVILRLLARREERRRREERGWRVPRAVDPGDHVVFNWAGLAVPPPPCSYEQDLVV